jgi:hypothetical protein
MTWEPPAELEIIDFERPPGRMRLENGSEVYSEPRHMQGICAFRGQGFNSPLRLSQKLSYEVPADRRAQLVYFRAGNSTDELICLILSRNGAPMRLFPVGARAALHVALAVIEDLLPGTRLEVLVAAPESVDGTAVVDVGLLEL